MCDVPAGVEIPDHGPGQKRFRRGFKNSADLERRENHVDKGIARESVEHAREKMFGPRPPPAPPIASDLSGRNAAEGDPAYSEGEDEGPLTLSSSAASCRKFSTPEAPRAPGKRALSADKLRVVRDEAPPGKKPQCEQERDRAPRSGASIAGSRRTSRSPRGASDGGKGLEKRKTAASGTVAAANEVLAIAESKWVFDSTGREGSASATPTPS